jgi:hypothetical protein
MPSKRPSNVSHAQNRPFERPSSIGPELNANAIQRERHTEHPSSMPTRPCRPSDTTSSILHQTHAQRARSCDGTGGHPDLCSSNDNGPISNIYTHNNNHRQCPSLDDECAHTRAAAQGLSTGSVQHSRQAHAKHARTSGPARSDSPSQNRSTTGTNGSGHDTSTSNATPTLILLQPSTLASTRA